MRFADLKEGQILVLDRMVWKVSLVSEVLATLTGLDPAGLSMDVKPGSLADGRLAKAVLCGPEHRAMFFAFVNIIDTMMRKQENTLRQNLDDTESARANLTRAIAQLDL